MGSLHERLEHTFLSSKASQVRQDGWKVHPVLTIKRSAQLDLQQATFCRNLLYVYYTNLRACLTRICGSRKILHKSFIFIWDLQLWSDVQADQRELLFPHPPPRCRTSTIESVARVTEGIWCGTENKRKDRGGGRTFRPRWVLWKLYHCWALCSQASSLSLSCLVRMIILPCSWGSRGH